MLAAFEIKLELNGLIAAIVRFAFHCCLLAVVLAPRENEGLSGGNKIVAAYGLMKGSVALVRLSAELGLHASATCNWNINFCLLSKRFNVG